MYFQLCSNIENSQKKLKIVKRKSEEKLKGQNMKNIIKRERSLYGFVLDLNPQNLLLKTHPIGAKKKTKQRKQNQNKIRQIERLEQV